MKKFLLLAPCAALVFGCSGSGNNGASNGGNAMVANTGGTTADGGNAGGAPVTGTAESGVPAPDAGATLSPGQWELTTRVTEIDVPGAPPQQREQMKAAMSQEQKQTQCLTQADVSNMAERLANQNSQGANCDFSRRTFAGGTIDIAGTCQSPGGRMELTFTGNYSGDSLQTQTSVNVSGGPQQMRMSATTTGRRIGDCPS